MDAKRLKFLHDAIDYRSKQDAKLLFWSQLKEAYQNMDEEKQKELLKRIFPDIAKNKEDN